MGLSLFSWRTVGWRRRRGICLFSALPSLSLSLSLLCRYLKTSQVPHLLLWRNRQVVGSDRGEWRRRTTTVLPWQQARRRHGGAAFINHGGGGSGSGVAWWQWYLQSLHPGACASATNTVRQHLAWQQQNMLLKKKKACLPSVRRGEEERRLGETL